MRRVLVLLAALALALAGCGGDDDGGGGGKDATALLKRGFATDVETGELEFKSELEVRGVPGFGDPFKLELDGPFRAASSPTEMPDLDMDFTASGAGQTYSGHVTTTQRNAWVEYQGETYEVGEELWARFLESLRQENQTEPDSFQDAGVDPLDWIAEAETDGEEELDGTSTTKVTGTFDFDAMLRDINRVNLPGKRLPESTLREIEDVVGDVDFEAWVGEDDIWRRLKADTDFEVPEDERDSAGGLEGGHISLDVRLENPNEPVQIEGQAGGHSIDQLLQQLGIPPQLLLGPGFSAPQPG